MAGFAFKLVMGAALVASAAGLVALNRRRFVKHRPLAVGETQRALLRNRFPLYARLTEDGRAHLDSLIERFLAEVLFTGRGGFQVTDEFRLIIAAQACLLVAGPHDRWFPTLKEVIVYPAEFKRRIKTSGDLFAPSTEVLAAGESWMGGPVVLAADHAVYGALVDDDRHNLVIHEFAHQLDEADGRSEGTPPLPPGQCIDNWNRVFQSAYDRLCADVVANRESVFDPYGAVSRGEFFAIAVETFFETPHLLRLAEPDVYTELVLYFGFDPMGA